MSDYSKWFWDNCDELNKDTSFAHSLSERCWNHQQKKIDKALKLIKDWEDQTYRDDLEQLLGEIEDILKGYDDE